MSMFRFSVASAGGRMALGRLELEWGNSLMPGCQMIGQPYWGWTVLSWGQCSWYFGQ